MQYRHRQEPQPQLISGSLISGGMDRQGVGAIACDRLQDGVSRLGPDEGLWVGIVELNECGDVGFEIVDAAMDAALELLVAEESEPAFYLIEPGRAGRGEVEVIARVAGEPRFHGRGLVGGVIVKHQMDVEIGRYGLLDLAEELAEFDRAVTLVAATDDVAGSDVQGGEQRGRAATLVVMAAPLDLTGAHRQQRLGAVECLNLRLLIDAQHQGAVGWVDVEPDNVA